MPNPGLSKEVQDAITRRSGPQPALNQVSPGAATAQLPQPTPQSQMTQASAPQGSPAGEVPKMPRFEPQDRQDLITVALIEQLKNDAKLIKEQGKMARGETQKPPAPQPQGGGGFSMSPGFTQPMPVNMMQGNYAGGMGKDYGGANNYGKGF